MLLNKRYTGLLFAFWMSGFMAFVMSGVLVAFHMGIDESFLSKWLYDYILAFAVAFPTTLVISPVARRLTQIFTKT